MMSMPVQLWWGAKSKQKQEFFLKIQSKEVATKSFELIEAEQEDSLQNGIVRSAAGGGDVDGLQFQIEFPERTIHAITNAQSIWKYLIQHTEPGAAQRLQKDANWRPDSRRISFELNSEGTRGFTLTIDQILREKTFWFPEFDLMAAFGEQAASVRKNLNELSTARGERVLDRVDREPESTYAKFASLWEDMGSPDYKNPNAPAPGQIAGIGWDSALYKFGIDRFARAQNDNSKIDQFNLSIEFADPAKAWRKQYLNDGLPIITTQFEEDGIIYDIEQFAAPLNGPPAERRGDMPMVLFQKVSLRNPMAAKKQALVKVKLVREHAEPISLETHDGVSLLQSASNTLLALQGKIDTLSTRGEGKISEISVGFGLPPNGKREFILELPSPFVGVDESKILLQENYQNRRAQTVRFWELYLARGAYFHVPDPAVNTLFRANLWHALCLPRRHGATNAGIDLPYSNFAYGQKGTPWPVNQSVYVDYMLYDLRGYHDIAQEELEVMFRNSQEPNGHIGGFASWGVYTPGMIYAVAQHYLLSGDRAAFEKLLPQTFRALDWCLNQLTAKNGNEDKASGLVSAPLNDLSHEARPWAFNQAYFAAGFKSLGMALESIHHPRAEQCLQAAAKINRACERQFGKASVASPAVQLADGTWSVYVPCQTEQSGRLFREWYPTDVDCGPLHLSRLQALDAKGPLTTAMLNDHEDNLFIHQWGMINEPVYNQQATAYLLRDEPKRVIRAFYSMMACAFSHTIFEPVEHRWGWGQYFGPPSTDGAWFELYRNMLLRETDDGTLLIGQATPRAWLRPGDRIEVRNAPSRYGRINLLMSANSGAREIAADLSLGAGMLPSEIVVRLRHPDQRAIKSASVNGKKWTDFDPTQESVRIPKPAQRRYEIIARY